MWSVVMASGVIGWCARFDPASVRAAVTAAQGRRRARSAQGAVELAEVADEQVGGVVGGPVAAAVKLVPGDDVGVVAVGEPADRPEVEGEAGQAQRDG